MDVASLIYDMSVKMAQDTAYTLAITLDEYESHTVTAYMTFESLPYGRHGIRMRYKSCVFAIFNYIDIEFMIDMLLPNIVHELMQHIALEAVTEFTSIHASVHKGPHTICMFRIPVYGVPVTDLCILDTKAWKRVEQLAAASTAVHKCACLIWKGLA
jgi:hypothetical protein